MLRYASLKRPLKPRNMDNPTGFAGLSQNEFSNVGLGPTTNVAEHSGL